MAKFSPKLDKNYKFIDKKNFHKPKKDKHKENRIKARCSQIAKNQWHKGKVLKADREKKTHYFQGTKISIQTYLSAETMQTRRQWKDIFKGMEGRKQWSLYSAKISVADGTAPQSHPHQNPRSPWTWEGYPTTRN